MKLLIVDDEYYLVQGLKKRINWAECGIDTVLEAYSTEQALQIYQDTRVDILLADVEMPRENGLSLIRKVLQQGYDSINILLTGHADFNYAQEAIQLRVFDYLVKPIESAQLILVITRAVEELQRRRSEEEAAQLMKRENFWQLLYSGELPVIDADVVQEHLEKAGLDDISVDDHFYYSYMLVKRADSSSARPESSPDAAPAMQADIRSLLTEESNIAAADRRGYMICTRIVPDVTKEMLRSRAEALVVKLGEMHPHHFFVLYTFTEAPLLAAPYACELLSQYAKRILTTGNKVVSILSPELRDQLEEDQKGLMIPAETWRDWLLQGRTDDILFQVRKLLGQRNTVYSVRYLSFIFYSLLDIVISAFSDRKLSPGDLLSRVSHGSDFAQASSSPESLVHWAENLLREADAGLKRGKETGSLMEQVRDYIEEHYSDPEMDREQIASAVHISEDYLSYLFHKENGCLLSAYVNDRRIAASRKMLQSTDLTLEEITERSGFTNSSYFHRQFKKLTGMTPTAYRKQYGKK